MEREKVCRACGSEDIDQEEVHGDNFKRVTLMFVSCDDCGVEYHRGPPEVLAF